jgi:ATP-dependent DNA helicase RecG
LFQTHIIATSPNILAHPIEYLKGVGPQGGDLLKKELAIFSFNDLLHHFPYRHIDKTKITKIIDLNPAIEYAQLQGKLLYYETTGERNSKRVIAYLKDDTGTMELTWFKGLSWIEKTLKKDEVYTAFGKISFFMGKPQIVHPELELIKQEINGGKNFLEPVYPAMTLSIVSIANCLPIPIQDHLR